MDGERMFVYRHKRKKPSSKKGLLRIWRDERTSRRREVFLNILRGVGETFVVLPTNRVQLTPKTANDRLRQSWIRTGQVVQLSMDEYEDASSSLNPQGAPTHQLQDAAL